MDALVPATLRSRHCRNNHHRFPLRSTHQLPARTTSQPTTAQEAARVHARHDDWFCPTARARLLPHARRNDLR
eukprot:5211687-Pleurochrysis_carterae.AAC.1